MKPRVPRVKSTQIKICVKLLLFRMVWNKIMYYHCFALLVWRKDDISSWSMLMMLKYWVKT